jgi:hypothetical protein
MKTCHRCVCAMGKESCRLRARPPHMDRGVGMHENYLRYYNTYHVYPGTRHIAHPAMRLNG